MSARGSIPGRVLRQRLPARLASVDAACRATRAFLTSRVQARVVFRAELLARECLNNAVIHGTQGAAPRPVSLEVGVGRKWIRIQVADGGRGFNWRRVRKARLRDAALPGGRGLAMCCLYARRVSFNQRGNRITLWISKQQQEA